MPSLSRGTLTQPETWGKAPVVVFYGLFFYSVQKLGSFVVVVLFFCTFSLQNMKYPTLMHWLASWVNFTSKPIFHNLSTTSQVPPVQFSLDSVALNFGPIWGHRPSLKHCVTALALVRRLKGEIRRPSSDSSCRWCRWSRSLFPGRTAQSWLCRTRRTRVQRRLRMLQFRSVKVFTS